MIRRRGFTLVEVLVGAVVLLVGFVPVYLLIAGSESGSVENERTVEALALAAGLLDELSSLPARALPAGPRCSIEDFRAKLPPAVAGGLVEPSADLAARFVRSVEVTAGRSCRRVKVVVTARGPATRGEGEIRLETLVTD